MSGTSKQRLDQRLLEMGQAESRSKAQALIMAGVVLVDGAVVDKPGTRVKAEADVSVKSDPVPFVSRGGLKLAGALDHFQVDVSGLVCLDIGSSTGGFTDCLLQRGAKRVYAIDVGKALLHWNLRNHGSVVVMEGVNARHLDPAMIEKPVDMATIDVSFISLTLILPRLSAVLADRAQVLALVKPQFEAGKDKVKKGGVIKDPRVQAQAVNKVACCAIDLGFVEKGRVPAVVKGPKGNQEHFIHLLWEQ